MQQNKIAVVLPTYKSKAHIVDVISKIDNIVTHIIVVDDACPQETGKYVESVCDDSRLVILQHEKNKGVGGAVKSGYQYSIENKIDIIIKIDSDGQMDPALIPLFINPLLEKKVHYTKGNRFFHPKDLKQMPTYRIIGNAGLSFFNKFASGYWKIFDPANGYTAIRLDMLKTLNLDSIDDRYFFESDMLYHLGLSRATVKDIPMTAVYGNEVSGLSARKNAFPFLRKLTRNTFNRIGYQYFVRDFSIASLELAFGLLLFLFGSITGAIKWLESISSGIPATGGEVMLAALPVILGFQLLLAFLNYDINNEPQ